MPRWQRTYVTACAFVMAFALAYVAVDYLRIPRLFHYQHEHLWRLQARPPSNVPAGYLGLWLWALLSGLAIGAASQLALRWRKKPISERLLQLLMAWSVTAVAIAGAYHSWNNMP